MSESLRVRNSNSIAKWVLSRQLLKSEIDGGNLKETGFEKKYFEIQVLKKDFLWSKMSL